MMIHLVIFFLILLVGFEDAKSFEIHEFSSDGIYLLIDVTTKFTDKKTDTALRDSIFDNEFFQKFDARTRTKQFDEIQGKRRKELVKASIWERRGNARGNMLHILILPSGAI